MKLFGGKQNGKIAEKPPDPKPAPAQAEIPAERTGNRGARRLLGPVLILCFALAALAGAAVLMLRPHRAAAPEEKLAAPPTVRPAVEPTRVIATPPPTEEPEETPEPTEEPVVRNDDCHTFVVLGRERQGAQTDTVIVGCLDTGAGTLDLVSIPRDTLVNVEWGVKKINSVMNFEDDPEGFLDRLSGLTGFRPDRYLILDAPVAEALISTIGGVYYTVPQYMDYDDPVQNLHIHLAPGGQWLNGENAVNVLRFRIGNGGTGYPDGDLGRIRTQQDLLGCLARQLIASGEVLNRERALELFTEYAATNISPEEITGFTDEFLQLDPENIRFYTAPGEAVVIRGGFYYQLDPDAWAALVNETLNPWSAPVEVEELDILREFGEAGAVSTSGAVVPMESFFNYYDYNG